MLFWVCFFLLWKLLPPAIHQVLLVLFWDASYTQNSSPAMNDSSQHLKFQDAPLKSQTQQISWSYVTDTTGWQVWKCCQQTTVRASGHWQQRQLGLWLQCTWSAGCGMHAVTEFSPFCTCKPAAATLLALPPPFAEAAAVPEKLCLDKELQWRLTGPQHQVLPKSGGRTWW